MNHGKLRVRHRAVSAGGRVELGNEPPLYVDGGAEDIVRRGRVSVRWFAGTVLTGLCGAALMGGAVYTALDGEAHFAAVPERAEAALRGTIAATERPVARKSDKILPPPETAGARQVIRVATTVKVGDRETMRVKPYVRVASNLALTTSELSANIPPFDPRRLLAGPAPSTPSASEEASTEPDPDLTFVMRDLNAVLGAKAKIAGSVSMAQVVAAVQEAAGRSSPVFQGIAHLTAAGTRLAYAAEGHLDPYAGFEARIVPENITLLPKTNTQATVGPNANERVIAVKKGDSAASILRELGASTADIEAILNVLGPRGRDGGLREGQKLRVLMPPALGGRPQPLRVIVANDHAIEAVVALSDTGRYVAVDVQSADTQVADADEDEADDGATGVRLYQSLYETALRHQVPRSVIDDFIRIHSYDVDFQRRVQPGDSFELLYGSDEEGSGEGRSEVLLASLTIAGETKRFYRFQTPDDGVVDYYDETGKSARKFLVRKPLGVGVMRSGYGWRRHPILGYSKMHTGVDWAAPRGTPVLASGNGVVETAGWEGGYGKYVKIRHTNGYQTAYGHLSAFARGIQPGARVRQGQVIGFVGSTGLSTGSHLHYEIIVNNRFVDPMRIKLPRGRALEGATLASFERERDRIEALMNRPASRLAQTQK